MHKLKKIFYFGLAAVLALVLFLVVFAKAQAHYVKFQAKQLLGVLRQVKVGTTSEAEVLRLTERFRSYQYYPSQEFEFAFYNGWASRLKLAAPAGLFVTVAINGGVVVTKSAMEWSGAAGPVAAARVSESKRGFAYLDKVRPSNHPCRTVYWEKQAPQIARDEVRRIFIEMDDTCPESQRNIDWAFDFSCLSQFGRGCQDAKTMLPNATPTPLEDENPSSTQQ